MNLSEIFIKRPVTTTLLILGILVFGVMAYRQLPVSDLPPITNATKASALTITGGRTLFQFGRSLPIMIPTSCADC